MSKTENKTADGGVSYSFPELSYLGRNDWWRYAVSFVTIASVWFALQVLGSSALQLLGKYDVVVSIVTTPFAFNQYSLGDGLLAFVFLLWSVSSALIPFVLVVPFLHRRPLSTFVFVGRFNWSGFGNSLFAWILVLGSYLIFDLLFGAGDMVFQFDAGRWVPFAVAALIFVPFQILAEEIVFRGYLLQMIGRRTRLYLVRLLVPACIFAALHVANQEVEAGGSWALASYFALAIYLGFLVLWGNGLEYALGLHLANNLFVALIVSSPDSTFGTPTLFRETAPDWDASTLVMTIVILALHFVVLRLFVSPLRLFKGARG